MLRVAVPNKGALSESAAEMLAEEISQLLYWTQVLMISRGLTLSDVYGKL